MTNPRHPAQWTVALGEGAEILADEFAITREKQDEFAVASHLRAAEAWDAGRFDAEVVSPFGADLKHDECVRAGASLESLARLKPVFRPDGRVTAGNSSPMNDGAAALLLGDEQAAESWGGEPLARIVSRAVSGVEPDRYGIGPVETGQRGPARGGMT